MKTLNREGKRQSLAHTRSKRDLRNSFFCLLEGFLGMRTGKGRIPLPLQALLGTGNTLEFRMEISRGMKKISLIKTEGQTCESKTHVIGVRLRSTLGHMRRTKCQSSEKEEVEKQSRTSPPNSPLIATALYRISRESHLL